MEVIIQNKGKMPVFKMINLSTPGTSGTPDRIFFEANGMTTKISQEFFEKHIQSEPYFQRLFEAGVLVNLNTVGSSFENANKQAQAIAELGYAKYKALMTMIKAAGGAENTEIAGSLDRDGMPKIDLVRSNMGNIIEPLVIDGYRNRYIAEKNAGIIKDTLIVGNRPISAGNPAKPTKEELDKAYAETVGKEPETAEVKKKKPGRPAKTE